MRKTQSESWWFELHVKQLVYLQLLTHALFVAAFLVTRIITFINFNLILINFII